jgi:hypothetical protein
MLFDRAGWRVCDGDCGLVGRLGLVGGLVGGLAFFRKSLVMTEVSQRFFHLFVNSYILYPIVSVGHQSSEFGDEVMEDEGFN